VTGSRVRHCLPHLAQRHLAAGESDGRLVELQIGSLAQHCRFQVAQLHTGIEPGLIGQSPAGTAHRLECLGLAGRAVQRQRQQGPQPLAERMTLDKTLEFRSGLPVPPERQPGRPEILDRRQAQLLQANRFGLHTWRRIGGRAEGFAVPEVECGLQEHLGPSRVCADRFREEGGESTRVDVDAVGQQGVARGARDQDRGRCAWLAAGLEQSAEPGDVRVQGGHGLRRRFVTPEQVNQSIRRDGVAVGGDQDRQQGALFRAAEVDGRSVDDQFDAAEHPDLHASQDRAWRGASRLQFDGKRWGGQWIHRTTGGAMTTGLPSTTIDTRDMNAVHTMFRREFRLAPGVVRAVDDGDTDQARVVADHLEFLTTVLHHHHVGEDELLWPKLLARVPEELAPIVHLMEAQHERVGDLLAQLEQLRPRWRATARPTDRDELARVLDELYISLAEHLEAEEERLLPIAARTVTEAEWHQLAEAGVDKLRRQDMPLVLGMVQYEGDPEVVAGIVKGTPVLIRWIVPRLSRRAFRKHALAVHGTATP
jgi:hemerythrin-like domain-containing protein